MDLTGSCNNMLDESSQMRAQQTRTAKMKRKRDAIILCYSLCPTFLETDMRAQQYA
jgi:hypothetical protein